MESPLSPRRWWPNFRLRTLLILLGIAAIGLAYLGNLRQRVLHQRRIVATLGAAYYEVGYDYEHGLGDSLDYEITFDVDRTYSSRELPDGRTERTITTSDGEWFIHVDRPPGPKLLSGFLGDDVFAHVESVASSWEARSNESKTFDPRILLELPELKVVLLHGSMVNDETLRVVAQIPKLRVLHLIASENSAATGRGLEELAAAKHLESLALEGDWITNETITGIRPLRSLKSLHVRYAPHLSANMFASVAEMRQLRELQFSRVPQLSDEGAEHLARLPNLRVFIAGGTSLSDATLTHVAKLPNLELLDVSHSQVSDAGMQHLMGQQKLLKLNASYTNVSDASLPVFARFPRLKILGLSNTAITDAGAPIIASMPQLESLDLIDTEIGDEGAFLIGSSHEYRYLAFGQRVSRKTVDQLRKRGNLPYWLYHNSPSQESKETSDAGDESDN